MKRATYRAAMYLRVSTAEQTSENQEPEVRELLERAKVRDGTVLGSGRIWDGP